MANYRLKIPYMLRELVSEIGQNLKICLGVPMNTELPPSTDEESEGTASIHFPGRHFVVKLQTGRGHYGQYINVLSVRCRMEFATDEAAREWIEKLQVLSGPTEWTSENGKLRFELAGKRWARLAMSALNRRNDLPEYRWDDPEHPWIAWGRQIGNPEFPNLPE